ncbi:MAG: flagellar hook-length control protein FliK [Gammaproteobacteria bacterium]|nr:flagellar hook-length control protein FliK [Gammaproteobacteria bacterium]
MGRLLTLTTPTRGADVLVGPIDASVSATAQAASPLNITTAPTLMTADESKTRENTRATTTVSELRSRAFNVSDVETADREPDAFAQEGETPSDGDRWETPSLVWALAPRSLDALIEMSSATDPLAGAAVIRPEAMTELPSRFRDLTSASTTHLPLPDPKMTAEDRSRTFAEAVAQRVIGQIRNENWSVSLQLEPLNMGSMDIDLSLRGTEVSATVGVANAEVRTLLEAGLPRLRETLESSGLQLAGWSFGQSGQRARGDSSPMPYVAQVYRERADDADIVTDVANAAMFRRGSESSRAVDLFV